MPISKTKNGKLKPTEPGGKGVEESATGADLLFHGPSNVTQVRGSGVTGAGSDGTSGLRVLKASGALTLAQDPTAVGHLLMPESVIRSGVVAKILSVDKCLPN